MTLSNSKNLICLASLTLLLFSACRPPEVSQTEGLSESATESRSTTKLRVSDYTRAVEYLVDFARSEDTDQSLDEKAIALALWLDPDSKEAFEAEYSLETSGSVPAGPDAPDKQALIQGAREILEELAPDDSHRTQDAKAYLADLGLSISPDDKEFAFLAHQLESKGAFSRWRRLTGSGGSSLSDSSLRGDQAVIKGLLVQELSGGTFAGKASQMNATVVDKNRSGDLSITFNQQVGERMFSALQEVKKYLTVRHGSWPRGAKVEIAFENQYSSKDGPSAAVACALLIDALITGGGMNENVAVTGDLNADGLVKAVGGIDGKISGAARRDCEIIIIPRPNEISVLDLLMIKGIEPLVSIQIFSANRFDEAHDLSRLPGERPAELNEAIEEFGRVQEVLGKPDGENWLKNQFVIEKLDKVVALAPNHLSAKYLLTRARNQEPGNLSLEGSLTQIDYAAEPLVRAIRQGRFDPGKSGLEADAYADALFALQRVRSKLDRRTLSCADAIIEFARLVREFVNNRPKSYNNLRSAVAEIENAGSRVTQEYDDLVNRVDVREELIE